MARLTGDGLVEPPVEPSYPLMDVVGFAVIIVGALVGGRERWRRHPIAVEVMALAASWTAAALVVRWSLLYARFDTANTLFTTATAASIAVLPLVADEVYAALTVHRPHHTELRPLETQGWLGYGTGITAILIGVWLLVAPLEAFREGAALRHGHLVGAFVIAIGTLSLAQVARPARWLNVAIGAWLMVAPLFLQFSLFGTVHLMTAGLLLMFVSTVFVPSRRESQQQTA